MKKLVLSFLLFLLSFAAASTTLAQKVKWDDEWKRVDSLINKQYYSQAYKASEKLFDKAVKAHQSRQILTGAWYLCYAGDQFVEDNADSSYARFVSIIPELDAVDQALCRLYVAEYLSSYYNRNRWRLTFEQPSDDDDSDFRLWPAERYCVEIVALLRQTLSNPQILRSQPAESLGALARVSDGKDVDLTPTVYDVAMYKAVEILNKLSFPRLLKSDVNNVSLFAAVPQKFVEMKIDVSDSSRSLAAFMASQMQQWEQFHLKRGSGNALLIKMYLFRLQSLDRLVNLDSKTSCLEYGLTDAIASFRHGNTDHLTLLYYQLAELMSQEERFVEAISLIDTALSLYPGSPYADRCQNLKASLTKGELALSMIQKSPSTAPQIAVLSSRNIDRVFFRVVRLSNSSKYGSLSERKKILKSCTALKEWSQPIAKRMDYKSQKTFATVPQLDQGLYILFASSDSLFNDDVVCAVVFGVEDIMFLSDNTIGNVQSGFVVNRTTGRPVAGLKVTLMAEKNYHSGSTSMAVTTTDSSGYYTFSSDISDNWKRYNKYHYYYVSAKYNGFEVKDYGYGFTPNSFSNEKHEMNNCFFDRPVYKPGDTLQFASLFFSLDRYDGSVVSDMEYRCHILNHSGVVVDSFSVVTDFYGVCSGSFVVPADATPGSWSIEFYNGSELVLMEDFVVECYKQPTYTVTLSKPAGEAHFGIPLTVDGMAASYSAVPVSRARVSYTVTRSDRTVPNYRYRSWIMEVSRPVVIHNGETETDETGHFTVTFTPFPDSNADLSHKHLFQYTVNVVVSDINGETHEASTKVNVGNQSCYVDISDVETPADGGGSMAKSSYDDMALSISCCDLDGNAISGTLHVSVSLLKQPEKPLLTHKLVGEDVELPVDKEKFFQMFPQYDFESMHSTVIQWPVRKEVLSTTVETTGDNPFLFSFKGEKTGAYLVEAYTVDAVGDTLVNRRYLIYEPSNAARPVNSSLISASVGMTSVEVGDTLYLRVGSRFNDVTVYLLVNKDEVISRHELHSISNGFIIIPIQVSDSMLGGFNVEVAAVKENMLAFQAFSIDVPYTHKKLDVEFVTFRDKLQPGGNERWTLRVLDKKADKPVPASMIMTMYDHALDNYARAGWLLTPWMPHYSNTVFRDKYYVASSGDSYAHKSLIYKDYVDYSYRLVLLKPGFEYYGHDRMMKSNGLRMYRNQKASFSADAMLLTVGDDAELSYVSEIAVESLGLDAAEVSLIEKKPDYEDTSFYLRKNLNTLAFFNPNIRFNDDGIAEISFSVPDLLTEWSIKGFVWTPDLKTGSLTAKTITRKRLMVVPNVPRFLRHGDTCLFSVKVSNMDDNEQDVAVSLQMTNAADNSVIGMICGDTIRHIVLKGGTSGVVSFKLAVPDSNIFVANYRVVARGQGCSDGEQAAIPLLTNRQLVTESLAFYIGNLSGSNTPKGGDSIYVKHYELTHLTGLDTTSDDFFLRHHALIVDITPNPIWMALQSLPYVSRQKNPSNVYLANAIYTNSLSAHIVDANPAVRKLFAVWSADSNSSSVSENGTGFASASSDITQTMLEATPWLADAVSERQMQHDMARFFDHSALNARLKDDIDKLLAAQRSDGGWSWIEGCEWSSLYSTQYILKTFGLLRQQGVQLDNRTTQALNRALDYVDRETYKYYKKYLKGKDYEMVNLDYLYLRSFYPDNKMSRNQQEAYNFFYNNAKKYNEDYRSLFSQSLLGIVFYRNGDKKLAGEMAKRIKEKALYSDEMGMYWRDNVNGCSWSERAIETQAMLIRLFAEVDNDYESVALMQQWLLKQKQTTNWNTDVATVNAIQALMIGNNKSAGKGGDTLPRYDEERLSPSVMSVTYGSHTIQSDTASVHVHISQRLSSYQITPNDGHIIVRKEGDGIAWGALYWQYFERVDKIPSSSIGVTMQRSLYRVNSDGTITPVLSKKDSQQIVTLKVGDKIRVRLKINVDRNLEYVELKEPRCAAFEPVNTSSGWVWNGGLSFYRSLTNTEQTLYIDRLDKGNYVVEYDLYVNNAGTYTTAPSTMQSLYAPEFRCLSPMPVLRVE